MGKKKRQAYGAAAASAAASAAGGALDCAASSIPSGHSLVYGEIVEGEEGKKKSSDRSKEPIVRVGRVDVSGKPACELCGVRLQGSRPDRPYRCGKAHDGCILLAKRLLVGVRAEIDAVIAEHAILAAAVAAAASSIPSISVRPPRMTNDPDHLASIRRATPLLLPPHEQWKPYHTAVFPPNEITQLISRGMCALAAQHHLDVCSEEHPILFASQTVISGDVVQTPISSLLELEEEQDGFLLHLQTLFREELRKKYLELNPTVNWNTMQFSGTKSLVSAPEHGDQAYHWDSISWTGKIPITCLLYCTPCNSARTPRFCTKEQLPLSKAALSRSFLLSDEYFHSIPLQPGSILLFRHDVIHAGSPNISSTSPRIALFDMIVPRVRSPNPEQQYFSWHYIREATSEDSKEYIEAIMKENAKHASLLRETKEEEDRIRARAAEYDLL